MDRRRFLLTSLAGAFAAPLAAEAKGGTVHRIGWLWGARPTNELLTGLREGLQEHGWVEGRSFVFEHRAAEGRADRQAELVADLLGLDVGVLVTSQSTAVKAAMAASRTLPIVMLGTGDPVRYGLVQSLARPGGQITGLALLVNEVSVKLLGLLREARLRDLACRHLRSGERRRSLIRSGGAGGSAEFGTAESHRRDATAR